MANRTMRTELNRCSCKHIINNEVVLCHKPAVARWRWKNENGTHSAYACEECDTRLFQAETEMLKHQNPAAVPGINEKTKTA